MNKVSVLSNLIKRVVEDVTSAQPEISPSGKSRERFLRYIAHPETVDIGLLGLVDFSLPIAVYGTIIDRIRSKKHSLTVWSRAISLVKKHILVHPPKRNMLLALESCCRCLPLTDPPLVQVIGSNSLPLTCFSQSLMCVRS